MKVSRVLQDARWRIRKPSLWCKHFVRIGNKRCAVGALPPPSSFRYGSSRQALIDVLPPGYVNISDFNDAHQHADVLALYDVAISAALSDEAGE